MMYRYIDPENTAYASLQSSEHRDAILRIYQFMDEVVGKVLDVTYVPGDGVNADAVYRVGMVDDKTGVVNEVEVDAAVEAADRRLGEEELQRIRLIEANVLDVETEQVDVVGAFNFSDWIFQTRPLMLEYFGRIRDALKDDGVSEISNS